MKEEDFKMEEYCIDNGYCLKRRIVYVDGDIREGNVMRWNRIIHMMESLSKEPIKIFISSFGGSVYDGLGLFDLLNNSKCRIETFATGKVMSMGLILWLAGDKRDAGRNTTFMAHQVSSGTFGKLDEMVNDVREAERLNNLLVMLLASKSEKCDINFWREFVVKDNYFTYKEAKKYGLLKKD